MEEDQAFQFGTKAFYLIQKKLLELRENPFQSLPILLESTQLYYLYSGYYFEGNPIELMNLSFFSEFLSFFVLQFMALENYSQG